MLTPVAEAEIRGGCDTLGWYALVTGKSGEFVVPTTATLPFPSTARPVAASVPLAPPKRFVKTGAGAV